MSNSTTTPRRRRRQWPLTLIMLIGGVLALAIASLYPLGYFYQATFMNEQPTSTGIAAVGEGYLLLYPFDRPRIAGAASGHSFTLTRRSQSPSAFLGFKWWFERRERPGGVAHIVPLWAIGLPPAAITGLAWVRRGAVRRGSCPKCGYDTRGLTHAACPKCGRTLGI